MKEKLINYATALIAHDKGFKLGIGWFNQEEHLFYFLGTLTTNYRGNNPVAAPQSLIQKWLRDEKNIHITVDLINNKNVWDFHIINVVSDNENNLHYTSINNYSSYEEALEAAILEALKLL